MKRYFRCCHASDHRANDYVKAAACCRGSAPRATPGIRPEWLWSTRQRGAEVCRCEDQRQAFRGDRPSDDVEGADRGSGDTRFFEDQIGMREFMDNDALGTTRCMSLTPATPRRSRGRRPRCASRATRIRVSKRATCVRGAGARHACDSNQVLQGITRAARCRRPSFISAACSRSHQGAQRGWRSRGKVDR